MTFHKISGSLYRASRAMTNVYLLSAGPHSILIDTGEPAHAPHIQRALEQRPPVRNIVLTHGHYDHSGSAAALSQALNAPVLAHPDEAALLRTGIWRRATRPAPDMLGRLMTRVLTGRFPDRVPAIPQIQPLHDATPLGLSGARIVPLPGHSAGQIGIVLPLANGTRAWIVGDTVMTAPRLREPILYEDRPLGLRSIAALADQVAVGDMICPGHGAPRRVTDRLRRALYGLANRG